MTKAVTSKSSSIKSSSKCEVRLKSEGKTPKLNPKNKNSIISDTFKALRSPFGKHRSLKQTENTLSCRKNIIDNEYFMHVVEHKKTQQIPKYDYKSSMFYTTDNNSENTVENRVCTQSIVNSPQKPSTYPFFKTPLMQMICDQQPSVNKTRNEEHVFVLKTQEESKYQSEIECSKTLSISSLNCDLQDQCTENEQSSCQFLDTSERCPVQIDQSVRISVQRDEMPSCDDNTKFHQRFNKKKKINRAQENFTPACDGRKGLCMLENRRIPIHTKIELESLVHATPQLKINLNNYQQYFEPKVDKVVEDSINLTSFENCKVATFKINLEDLNNSEESMILRRDASKSSTLILSMNCNPSCGDLNLSTILQQIDEQS